MVGFTADNGAEGDQGVVFARLGELLQRERDFEGTRHGHLRHVLFHHAELAQFVHAVLEFTAAGIFVEAGDHDADAKVGTVEFGGNNINSHVCLLGASAGGS